jgi:hypothetical protein
MQSDYYPVSKSRMKPLFSVDAAKLNGSYLKNVIFESQVDEDPILERKRKLPVNYQR